MRLIVLPQALARSSVPADDQRISEPDEETARSRVIIGYPRWVSDRPHAPTQPDPGTAVEGMRMIMAV